MLSGALLCICIAHVKVQIQMRMRMQGEWPCPWDALYTKLKVAQVQVSWMPLLLNLFIKGVINSKS